MTFYDIHRVDGEGISGEHSGFSCSSSLHKMTGNITLLQIKYFHAASYSKTNNLAVLESKSLFCMPRNNWY